MKLQDIHTLTENTMIDPSQRINRKDIAATIKHISELSGIPKKHFNTVGSAGKASSSSDINLVVGIDEYDPKTTHEIIKDKLNGVGTFDEATNTATYNFDVKGDSTKGKVKVDIRFTSNVDWSKFSYHSDGEQSKYKGAVRSILLTAVTNTLNKKGSNKFEYTGSGVTNFRTGKDPLNVDNPEKVVKLLFGGSASLEDVANAEKVIRLIKKKFDEQQQSKIFAMAASLASDLKGKIKLPSEIQDRI